MLYTLKRKKNTRNIKRMLAAVLAFLLSFGTVFETGKIEVHAEETVPYAEFPESYRPYLIHLHDCYPNWKFVPDIIVDSEGDPIDFWDAVDAEAVSSKSLVQNVSGTSDSYKSTKSADYNMDNDTWRVYDGTNWIAASREAVAYYMDPRNWMITTSAGKCRSIFQFLDYTYDPVNQTEEGLENMIRDTFLEGEVIVGSLLSTAEIPGLSLLMTSENGIATPSDVVLNTEIATPSEAVTDTETATPSEAQKESDQTEEATPSEAERGQGTIAEVQQTGDDPAAEESEINPEKEPDTETEEEAETEEETETEEEEESETEESAAEQETEIETEESEAEESAIEEPEAEEPEAEEPEAEEPEAEEPEAEEPETEETGTEESDTEESDTEESETEEPATETTEKSVTEADETKESETEDTEAVEEKKEAEIPLPAMLEASALSTAEEDTYVSIIMEAVRQSSTDESKRISPYVLASFIIQEQGTNGTSPLISGEQPDYPGIYNYFNVGAYATDSMTNVQRGLWWASGQDNNSDSYGRPWNTPQKAIIGGAKYLAEGYLQAGQNTIYYKRFNVGPNRTKTIYLHQYMTNIAGAQAEGWKLGMALEENGVANKEYTFHIPVFANMPENACPDPKNDTDNRLALLSVNGYSISPAFSKNTTYYSVTVPAGTQNISISAQEETAGAVVTGTGYRTLTGDKTVVPVIVTAPSGAKRIYRVTVNRKASSENNTSGNSSSGSSGSGGSSGGGSSGGGGGGGAAGPVAKKTSATFSEFWFTGANGEWQISNSGQLVKSAWLCDDDVASNGQNVWYLMNTDGTMLAAGLVQDNTGNYYSLETNHNGYYGMLRYQDGTYDCDGVKIYMEFSRKHDGTFGAVKNQEAIDALKAKYGVTKFGVGNESCTYTSTFK